MTEKELLYQVANREISNILGAFNPSLKLLSPAVTNFLMSWAEPYIAAFSSPDTGKINKKAASEYFKEETSKKIDEFMKRFAEESNEL